MAKRPPPGKCIHCLKDPVERNWDHVFPEAWYPASSSDVYKWQVPSCIPCNKELGTIENDFLRYVGLSLDAQLPASKAAVQKALRALDPSKGKNERDRRVRASLRRRVLAEALLGDAIPKTGVYPGLAKRGVGPSDEDVAILVPAESFRRITEKIVRGIFYLVDGTFIEPPYQVEFFALDSSVSSEIRRVIDRFGTEYAREPGIVVRRAVTPDDGVSSIFEIEFWHQFKTHAFVTRKKTAKSRGPGPNRLAARATESKLGAVRQCHPFLPNQTYTFARLRAEAAKILSDRQGDPALSAKLRTQRRTEAPGAKAWNEELCPLRVLADHMRLSDDDTFIWTPDGAADFELRTPTGIIKIQVTMAYPEWSVTVGQRGGYIHNRQMEKYNTYGYCFGGGLISSPRVRGPEEDLRAWRAGIKSALTNKLQTKSLGCRLLIFARGCWFNMIDFPFAEVVTPAVHDVGTDVWRRAFETIYIVDSHATAFTEVLRD